MSIDFRKMVARERIEQCSKWGGSSHDDKHSYRDWLAFVTRRMGKLSELGESDDLELMGQELVEIAALVEAWHESLSRKLMSENGAKPSVEQWEKSLSQDKGFAWGVLRFPGTMTPVAFIGFALVTGTPEEELLEKYSFLSVLDLEMARAWYVNEQNRYAMDRKPVEGDDE